MATVLMQTIITKDTMKTIKTIGIKKKSTTKKDMAPHMEDMDMVVMEDLDSVVDMVVMEDMDTVVDTVDNTVDTVDNTVDTVDNTVDMAIMTNMLMVTMPVSRPHTVDMAIISNMLMVTMPISWPLASSEKRMFNRT